MTKYYLTTVDNPFNPATDFENWYRYDMDHDYCSSEYLMRVAIQSSQLSPAENEHEIEVAIDSILAVDFMHIYKKFSYELSEEEIEAEY